MSMVRSTPTSGLTRRMLPLRFARPVGNAGPLRQWLREELADALASLRKKNYVVAAPKGRAACLAPSAVVSSVALLEPSLLRPTIHKGLCLLPRALFEQIVMGALGKEF